MAGNPPGSVFLFAEIIAPHLNHTGNCIYHKLPQTPIIGLIAAREFRKAPCPAAPEGVFPWGFATINRGKPPAEIFSQRANQGFIGRPRVGMFRAGGHAYSMVRIVKACHP